MGQDFGQNREWSEERELDWNLLTDPLHAGMKAYVAQLLKIYQKYPCLYLNEKDSWETFEWINADDRDKSVYTFYRKGKGKAKNLLFVMNFTPVNWEDYRIGVPKAGKYKCILNSDDIQFGGKGMIKQKIFTAEKKEWDQRDYSIAYAVPGFSAAIFEF